MVSSGMRTVRIQKKADDRFITNIQQKRQNTIPPEGKRRVFPSARPVIFMKKYAAEAAFFPFRGCLFPEYGVFYLFVMNFST
jgi:hypothetical protein